MAYRTIITAGALVGIAALVSPQPAAATAALGAKAGQAALPAADTAGIVKVAEVWRGERWRHGGWRGGGKWRHGGWRHKRWHRHKWRKRYHARRRYWRRHHHHHYYRDNDVGIVLGATGLFLGLSALAARPYYGDSYYGRSYYGGYSGTVSDNCSRFQPWSTPWYQCCSAKYRTFDPSTGRYRAYSGRLRFCQ